jgi:hypothetical protein
MDIGRLLQSLTGVEWVGGGGRLIADRVRRHSSRTWDPGGLELSKGKDQKNENKRGKMGGRKGKGTRRKTEAN